MTSMLALIVTEVLVSVWRQRLWFQPHWHAAALLLGCTRVRRNLVRHCNVAQSGRASSSQLLVSRVRLPLLQRPDKSLLVRPQGLGFDSPC